MGRLPIWRSEISKRRQRSVLYEPDMKDGAQRRRKWQRNEYESGSRSKRNSLLSPFKIYGALETRAPCFWLMHRNCLCWMSAAVLVHRCIIPVQFKECCVFLHKFSLKMYSIYGIIITKDWYDVGNDKLWAWWESGTYGIMTSHFSRQLKQ
eukprot:IDg15364t1